MGTEINGLKYLKDKMIKVISIFIFLILAISFHSCDQDNCSVNINSWIKEAPTALDEFFLVRNEILLNKKFLNKFSLDNSLFLREMDTLNYFSYNMPNLTNWFRKGRGYISFSKSDTSFCFKSCNDYPYSALGKIYYKRMKHQYKISVIIVDSMKIENDWIAHVIKCKGCDD